MNAYTGTMLLNLSRPTLRRLFPHVFMLTLATGIGIALHRTSTTSSLFETISVTIMLALLQYGLLAYALLRDVTAMGRSIGSMAPLLSTQGQVKELADPCFQYVADRSLANAAGPTCDVSPQGVTLTPSGVVFEAYKFFWEYFLHQPKRPQTIYCVHSTPIHIWNERPDLLELQGTFPKGTITRIIVGEEESFAEETAPYIKAIRAMLDAGTTVYYVQRREFRKEYPESTIHDFVWVEDSRHMFQWTKGDDGITVVGAEIRSEPNPLPSWEPLKEVIAKHKIKPMTEPEDYKRLFIGSASEASAAHR